MSKCNQCEGRLILMTGRVYLEADAEPYEAGKEEIAEVEEVEAYISCHYCTKCEKLQDLNHDSPHPLRQMQ